MKKIIYVLFAAVLLFGTTAVSALTKDELKEKLTAVYEVNGVKFRATESQRAEIERYIEKNNLSDTDATYIATKFDEAVAIIRKGNATSLDELTQDEKEQIIKLINDVADKTNVKLTISKGVVTVYNLDGTVFTKVDNVVKYTDSSNILVTVASTITVVGIAAIALKLKKENA